MNQLTILLQLFVFYIVSHKELVTELIFHAAISDPLRQARCLALFQVGMICMKELSYRPNSNRIVQAMDILLASLKVVH